jgi:hypothetical protein
MDYEAFLTYILFLSMWITIYLLIIRGVINSVFEVGKYDKKIDM